MAGEDEGYHWTGHPVVPGHAAVPGSQYITSLSAELHVALIFVDLLLWARLFPLSWNFIFWTNKSILWDKSCISSLPAGSVPHKPVAMQRL